MRYEGTISPETMTNLLSYWRAKASHAGLEAAMNRAHGHPRVARQWEDKQAHNLAIVDLLERAVQAERERTTED